MERRVLGWLRDREAEMADLLRRLVLAETPSLVPGSERAALALLEAELLKAGYSTSVVRGSGAGDHLYARPAVRRRRSPRQLVLGHVDTVWPLGTVDAMRPRVEDGFLYGPGAYDMKGGLVQLAFALRALHELGAVPSVTPVILLNSDEETGSQDSIRWIRLLACGAVRAFVLEPPAGPAGELKTGRKGVGRFRVLVRGRAAHAGGPERGASAIRELALQVERLFALNDPSRGVSVNVGTIDGGLRANVVAPQASALVDVRVPASDAAVRLERAIRSPGTLPAGVDVTVDGAFDRPPMIATARNRALFEQARILGARLGLDLRQAGQAGGGSDANFTSELTATLDGLGAVGDGAHAVDEHVVVSAMPERAALLALLLLEPR